MLSTMMAGLMLIAAGLLRFGRWIKYIPEPVVTGFTAVNMPPYRMSDRQIDAVIAYMRSLSE